MEEVTGSSPVSSTIWNRGRIRGSFFICVKGIAGIIVKTKQYEKIIHYCNTVLQLSSSHTAVGFIEKLEEYIEYYNNERISLELKGMSPVQYRAHSQTI